MQITSNTKTEKNNIEVEFSISADEFENAVQSAFMKKRRNIQINGFRKGKASRKMVEANYGEGIFYEDAVNDLYRDSIPKVIDELKLEIVDTPAVEVTDINKESGVTFKVKLTVKPEIEISDYKGLEVELEKLNVCEEDIDEELNKILADNARIIDASDTPVANGEIIKFDFSGFCEGEAFDGGTAKDFELEIGSGRFIPGFEEQIIGKNIGEDFEINVTFPEDYFSENVRGKNVLFKCKIHEKSSKETAELDDEFVKDISEFDTIDELRDDVRKKIEQSNDEIRDMELERELAEKVVELMKGDIPDAMYEYRIDELARDWALKYNMRAEDFAKQSGMTYEKYRDGFREIAEKQVKFRLSLEKIAQIEDIPVSKDEIDAEYEKMSKENHINIDRIRNIVSESSLELDLKTEKALVLLKEAAVIKDKVEV
ncbi:MAG: trigger factor [Oscillospiraceae bacterium]|nr:trigger factor [Oscillospiraceae bacterium]